MHVRGHDGVDSAQAAARSLGASAVTAWRSLRPAYAPPTAMNSLDDDQRAVDRVYRHYVETCRLSDIEPVPRDRAQEWIAEWSAVIAAFQSVRRTKH